MLAVDCTKSLVQVVARRRCAGGEGGGRGPGEVVARQEKYQVR